LLKLKKLKGVSKQGEMSLAKIAAAPNTSLARALAAAERDPEIKEAQKAIQRQLLREELEASLYGFSSRNNAAATGGGGDVKETEDEALAMAKKLERERIAKLLAARARRTQKLIANPTYTDLYTMMTEREVLTDFRLKDVLSEMDKASRRKNASTRLLASVLRQAVTDSLFGCDVLVGVGKDASCNVIEFIGKNSNKGGGDAYTKRETRGLSVCFECIDQKDVVVHTVTRPLTKEQLNALRIERLQGGGGGGDEHEAKLTQGEAVVYVPLLGKRGGVGCLEIHGLFSEGLTDPSQYHRKTNVLRAMIAKQDFRFTETVRLWRLPGDRLVGTIPTTKFPKYQVSLYNVVCGKIQQVIFEREGVPYAGGPRYSLEWEDGLFEEAVTAGDLCKLFANTPTSLGTSTKLDLALTERLLKLGIAAGETLERQFTNDALSLVKKKLNVPNLGDMESFERALDILLSVVTKIREASLFVFNEKTHAAVQVCERLPDLIHLVSLGVLPPAASLLSPTEVVRMTMAADLVRAANASGRSGIGATESWGALHAPLVVDAGGGSNTEFVCVELEVPLGFVWQHEPAQKRFFVMLLRTKSNFNPAVSTAENDTFSQITRVLSECIDIAWKKEQRTKARRELVKEVEAQLFVWRNLSLQEMCQNTMNMAARVLPGTDVYIGLLGEGGYVINFLSATSNSQMMNKVLARGKGIGFDVIEHLETLFLAAGDTKKSAYLVEGANVMVMYGRRAYKGKIHKDRGHEKYDVEYLELDKKIEAGVDITRIIPQHTAFRMFNLGGKLELPYLCIPLRHRAKGVGVIGMDNFKLVPRAPYDPQPEQGLVLFLEQLGRILGKSQVNIKYLYNTTTPH